MSFFALTAGLDRLRYLGTPAAQTDADRRSPPYRADVDGLRAIAVAAVVYFHLFAPKHSGGFVGVDVFFVISGFLITDIIVQAQQRGTFSVVEFYRRRVLRIFPALILVLAFCLLVGFFTLLPGDFKRLARHLGAGTLFYANIEQIAGAGYFAEDAKSNPLLHLWSLGVEEQFYIAWPLLLHLARRRIGWAIAGVFIVSFVINVVFIHRSAIDFFSPMTRAWELALGGLLVPLRNWRERSVTLAKHRNTMAVVGAALMFAAFATFAPSWSYPGWKALVPTLGAALLIGAGADNVVGRLLAWRLATYIGRLSYAIYLWHWPLLTFFVLRFGEPDAIGRSALLILTLGLAAATYHLLETPLRRAPMRTREHAAALLGLGSGLLVAAAGVVYSFEGFPSRVPQTVRVLAAIDDPYAFFDFAKVVRAACFDKAPADLMRQNPSPCVERRRPLVFLWGDSYAATLWHGLDQASRVLGFGVAQFTSGDGPPFFLPGRRSENGTELTKLNGDTLDAVKRLQPELIILT